MSETWKTVVIGTSLTEESESVVRTGVAFARAAGAAPWLVHAYALPVFAPEVESGDGRWLELQEKVLRRRLAQQASRTGLDGLSGFTPEHLRLTMGSPSRQIVELARHVKADLIVVGAADTGALHRAFLGGTADRVIRKAPCPVLVVRSEAAFPPTRTEIPVDLSLLSAHALRSGLSFLSQAGAPLAETEVLLVLNPFEVAGSAHFTPEQIERFAGEELRRFLAASRLGTAPRLSRVRIGYPRDVILAVLKERRADLAVLGTHGRGGFERLMLGSVAAGVMHQAHCNLLIIPPEAGFQEEPVSREEIKSADWIFVSDVAPVPAGRR